MVSTTPLSLAHGNLRYLISIARPARGADGGRDEGVLEQTSLFRQAIHVRCLTHRVAITAEAMRTTSSMAIKRMFGWSAAYTDEQKAEVFHNVGNTLLKTKKLKESVGAYTESLKLNPNDLETKYNLSYALKQMQQQEQNKDKNKDKNDKDKDDKKDDQKKDQNKDDQEKDKNKDKEDKKDQQNQDNKDDKKEEKKEKQQQQQPSPEISKEEAQRILDALKDDEADMQKELRKKKGKKVKVEKDW